MLCRSCGRELPRDSACCPQCGVVPDSRPVADSSRRQVVALLVISFVVIAATLGFGLLAWAKFGRPRIANTPPYRQSLLIAKNSREVLRALGAPLTFDQPTGRENGFGPLSFVEWSVAVHGPAGKAHLYGVSNRVGKTWQYSDLSVVLESRTETISLAPSPALAAGLPKYRAKVFLVPLDLDSKISLEWAPDFFREKLGIEIEVLPAVPLNSSVEDANRGQLIAEKLLRLMLDAESDIANDPSNTIIGVTSHDMYIPSIALRWSPAFRFDGRSGIVSTFRLSEPLLNQQENSEFTTARLRKLLFKNIEVLALKLPMSSDPTSVLSWPVSNGADVDLMTEEIVPPGSVWRPVTFDASACVATTISPSGAADWRPDCSHEDAPPGYVAGFELFLDPPLFEIRRTDFALDESAPFRFVRVYRELDLKPRAFGFGANDSYDIYLVGDMSTYCSLVLEDGGQIRFRRDPAAPNRQRYINDPQSDRYSRAVLLYEGDGWTLSTNDGWKFFFPYRPQARGDRVTVLTGAVDPSGRQLKMERDASGNLLHLTTPLGDTLEFKYNSANLIQEIRDSNGRSFHYQSDSVGRLIQAASSDGILESYEYDDKSRMIAVRDRLNAVEVLNAYEDTGELKTQRFADGQNFEFRYQKDAKGTVGRIDFIDPAGMIRSFTVSAAGYSESLPRFLADSGSANHEQH